MNLENTIGHRAHGGKHRAHGGIAREIARKRHYQTGELKFVEHQTAGISPRTPSELSALCEEIDQRNLA